MQIEKRRFRFYISCRRKVVDFFDSKTRARDMQSHAKDKKLNVYSLFSFLVRHFSTERAYKSKMRPLVLSAAIELIFATLSPDKRSLIVAFFVSPLQLLLPVL